MLRKTILERFPTDHVERYIEVFGGAGWVLFAKEKKKGQLEVINDMDGQLVNLYRCVKYHCGELQRELSWMPTSREEFNAFLEQVSMPGLTDIQRAARFLYLVKLSFGSDHRTFATGAKTVVHVMDYLPKIQERLVGVNIENKDFADLIKVYDRKSALFYLDPPYVGTERYYEAQFTAEDHRRLRDTLRDISGRFILSYNDDPLVLELYSDYRIESVTRRQALAAIENKKPYAELIIRNF